MENRYFADIERDRKIRGCVVMVIIQISVLLTGIRLFHVLKAEDVVKKIPSAVVLKTEFFGSGGRVIVEFHTSETLQYQGGSLSEAGVHRAEVMDGKIVKLDDVPLP